MTSTMTHTRGPWVAHKGKKTIGIYEPTGVAVGYVHTSQFTEARKMADARLIAAAPEMLAALESLTHPMASDEDLQNALAVIAKAKGGEA